MAVIVIGDPAGSGVPAPATVGVVDVFLSPAPVPSLPIGSAGQFYMVGPDGGPVAVDAPVMSGDVTRDELAATADGLRAELTRHVTAPDPHPAWDGSVPDFTVGFRAGLI